MLTVNTSMSQENYFWHFEIETKKQLRWSHATLHICRLVGCLVERCFLEDEPAVASPHDEVEKSKNLQKDNREMKKMSGYSSKQTDLKILKF